MYQVLSVDFLVTVGDVNVSLPQLALNNVIPNSVAAFC